MVLCYTRRRRAEADGDRVGLAAMLDYVWEGGIVVLKTLVGDRRKA